LATLIVFCFAETGGTANPPAEVGNIRIRAQVCGNLAMMIVPLGQIMPTGERNPVSIVQLSVL
jgi:hypothetical protein